MDAELLRLTMIYGELLAMTPPRRKVGKLRTKVYAVFVAAVVTTSSLISTIHYRQPLYGNFSYFKMVLATSMVLIVTIFNCYVVLAPVFGKRAPYCFLMRILQDGGRAERDKSRGRIRVYLGFIAPNFVYWVNTVYGAYVWSDILGFSYFQEYFVEVIQQYFQFYYSYFLCLSIRIILSRYRYVNFLLSQQIRRNDRSSVPLRRLEGSICLLKESTEAFNDVFGWAVVMMILYSSILLLNYLDDIFKNSFGYSDRQFLGVIVSNVTVVLLTNVGPLCIIFQCNSVLDEARKTLSLSYRLQRNASVTTRRETFEFIHLVVNNLPEFTAAGFFSIRRNTVLQIASTVMTFFIIIVQFNMMM